jgi:hypothetical protein
VSVFDEPLVGLPAGVHESRFGNSRGAHRHLQLLSDFLHALLFQLYLTKDSDAGLMEAARESLIWCLHTCVRPFAGTTR